MKPPNILFALGRSKDTLVVFTSDHGEVIGEHRLARKDVVYEGAVRIPLMFRLPGRERKHRMVEGRVSLVDLAPTLTDYAWAGVPSDMQGRSRRAVIEERETLDANDVFLDWDSLEEFVHRPSRTIITADGWKMNVNRLHDLVMKNRVTFSHTSAPCGNWGRGALTPLSPSRRANSGVRAPRLQHRVNGLLSVVQGLVALGDNLK